MAVDCASVEFAVGCYWHCYSCFMLAYDFMAGAYFGHHYHAGEKQYRQRDQACGGAGPFNDNNECEYHQYRACRQSFISLAMARDFGAVFAICYLDANHLASVIADGEIWPSAGFYGWGDNCGCICLYPRHFHSDFKFLAVLSGFDVSWCCAWLCWFLSLCRCR